MSVSQDYQQALKWYSKAAEQGHSKAQYNLGGLYYSGKGVTKDYQQAFKWYSKAAEQGVPQAQFNLGTEDRVLLKIISKHLSGFQKPLCRGILIFS